MALSEVLRDLRGDTAFMSNVMAWRTVPARPGRFAPIPNQLQPLLRAALHARGIDALYLHQAQALDLAWRNADFAVTTPTASGKTLCYTLPVLHTLLGEPDTRALFLFPTKALAHDQLDELNEWRAAIGRHAQSPTHASLTFAAYDGDTPEGQRAAIRRNTRLLLTNPDMLHAGILPYHTAWADFFAGLRFVVIDEMHTYRGVFGSHVANVLRRLQRICALYGGRPQFVAASATIANPQQLAEQLIERPVTVVGENGAPQVERQVILYNPPLYDAERGLRRSSVLEAQALAARCVLGGLQTIVFARARLTTEVLLTYLRDRLAHDGAAMWDWEAASTPQAAIRGYRGGYLPAERRAIEDGLRSGAVRAVVATNALELGIDIGRLQAAILCGYPGTIAATWQRVGRAGRDGATATGPDDGALAILVATGGALDQYVIRHPEFLFERSPEQALVNPDNLMILVDQLRCAAFEAPFAQGEQFGASPYTADVLQLLAEQGDVRRHNHHYFWSGEGYPARRIGLRTSGSDSVTIQAQSAGAAPTVIGQLDVAGAIRLLHSGAIYFHEGRSFRVEQLDLEQRVAYVAPITVDYYTEAAGEMTIDRLAEHGQRAEAGLWVGHGDVRVQSQITGFRRIKRYTHENLGVQPLDYPPQMMETTAYWLTISPATQRALEATGQWYDSPNDYGPNWQAQRARVRARDGYRCSHCGAPEPPGREHDVHHLIPFRTFGYVVGLNEHFLVANQLQNLTLVCRSCHRRLESSVRVHTGMDGLAYALGNLAPLHLMCDPQDIGVHVVRADAPLRSTQEEAPTTAAPAHPTIFVYEQALAGLGFSARLYEQHDALLAAARTLVQSCPCTHGCPACVGPVLENESVQLPTKQLTLALLAALIEGPDGLPPHTAPSQPGEVDFYPASFQIK